MAEEFRRLGRIEVSSKAVASVAARAVTECYGVVGMASKTLRDGLAVLLQKDNPHRGVDVHFEGPDAVVVDLFVILEYGVRISEVALQIMTRTRFAIRKALGTPGIVVNVNVQGVRISDID